MPQSLSIRQRSARRGQHAETRRTLIRPSDGPRASDQAAFGHAHIDHNE
jgi:hypothetical protein